MTDKPRPTHSIFSRLVKKAAISLSVGSVCFATSIQSAEQEWWFDVEVILFERHLDPNSILEQFEQSSLLPPKGDVTDLLSPYLQPDLTYLQANLAYCRDSKIAELAKQRAQDFAFPEPAPEPVIEPETEISPDSELETSDNTATEQPLTQSSEQAPQQAEDNFEYEVVSSDIFAEQNNQATNSSGIAEAQVINEEGIEENNLDTALESPLAEQGAEPTLSEQPKAVARTPITVDFIEWQIPDSVPCVYAEQVDPLLFLNDSPFTQFANSFNVEQTTEDLLRSVPVVIDGIEWQEKRGAFLLPSDTFRMPKLFNSIQKQRNISPMLHVNWRQEVKFGRENAQSFRLFAGKNYAKQFTLDGQAIIQDTDSLIDDLMAQEYADKPAQPLANNTESRETRLSDDQQQALSTHALFNKIDAALAEQQPIDFTLSTTAPEAEDELLSTEQQAQDIWQLDGEITVYLRRIGRVPYLHIDSNLDYRQPIYPTTTRQDLTTEPALATTEQEIAAPQPYLQSVNFNQLRRVISKQVHYFDHPLFGMIVRIHRYRWPELAVQEETEAAD